MKTRHGVLTNEGVLTIQDNRWNVFPDSRDIRDIVDLLNLGNSIGLTHLWVHADSGIELPAPIEVKQGCFKSNDLDGWDVLGHMHGPHIKSVNGYIPGGAGCKVIFPHHSRWGTTGRVDVPGWGKAATPKQLLVTISYLEQALGVAIGTSPGTTGWDLHKKMHPEWVANYPKVNLDTMHFRESARDLVAQWPVTSGKYLHKIDKNSAYLYSCAFNTFYGVGNPVIDPNGSKYTDKTALKDGHRPGAWYCDVIPGDRLLPNYEKAGKRWLAGPIIRLMRKVGYEVRVLNGWYFPDCHQLMEKWSSFLWDTRQSFKDATKWRRSEPREFAYQAIKQIAVATVGLTSFLGFEADEETDKKRPDIKSLTVARTYELMYYNILKFQEITGCLPVMVYMDALYYISDSPKLTGTASDTAQMLARQDKLGGFKYEGSIEITSEVSDILSAKTNVAKKLELLNKIGWTK